MKKIYLLRGAPSAGKSTLVQRLNLTKYTISLATIQDMYGTPAIGMTANQQIIAYRRNNTIEPSMKLMIKLAETRMQADQTVIIDAPNITAESIQPFAKLAKKYLYQLIVVNVGTQLLLQNLLERNNNRPLIDQASNAQIRQSFSLLQTEILPKTCIQMTVKQFENDLAGHTVNVSHYRDILVIGDIQSCGTALKKVLGTYRKDRLYILLGDYFDRGCEPITVMRTLMKLIKLPNVVLIRGNHESHLEHFASDMTLTGNSFQKETLPALIKAGYTRSDVRHLLMHTQPIFLAIFHNQEFCFTHAGLTNKQLTLRAQFSLQDDLFFTKGIGGYDYDLDNEFDHDTKHPLIQFHGHRNSFNYPIFRHSHQKSFNLEQKVEHGNYLGAVLINYQQSKLHYINYSVKNDHWNKNYVPYDQKSNQKLDLHVLLKSHKLQAENLGYGLRLITVKPKYRTSIQWTDQMTHTDQIVVDTGSHLIARSYPHPVRLTYHNHQVVDILHKLKQTDLTVLTDLRSPTIIVSFVKRLNQLLIYSPDAKNKAERSNLQNLLKAQINLKQLTDMLRHYSYSLVFQLENHQLVLVTAVANTYQGALAPKLATSIANQYQLPTINVENWSLQTHKKQYLHKKIGQLQLKHNNNLINIDDNDNSYAMIAI